MRKQFVIVETIKRSHVITVDTDMNSTDVNSVLSELGNVADTVNDIYDMMPEYEFDSIETNVTDDSVSFEIGPVAEIEE